MKKILDECNEIFGNTVLVFDKDVYEWLNPVQWTPSWVSDAVPEDEYKFTMFMTKELEAIEGKLGDMYGMDKQNDENKFAKATVEISGPRLSKQAAEIRFEGWMEYLFFIINLIAFYGYLLGIVSYYFEKDDEQPDIMYYIKLGLKSIDADWGGILLET